ncbi:MAG: hypothetical protein FWF59_11965 [Turicibacter sp.]|nr:hypothetical protein [Turicibacter sp.]
MKQDTITLQSYFEALSTIEEQEMFDLIDSFKGAFQRCELAGTTLEFYDLDDILVETVSLASLVNQTIIGDLGNFITGLTLTGNNLRFYHESVLLGYVDLSPLLVGVETDVSYLQIKVAEHTTKIDALEKLGAEHEIRLDACETHCGQAYHNVRLDENILKFYDITGVVVKEVSLAQFANEVSFTDVTLLGRNLYFYNGNNIVKTVQLPAYINEATFNETTKIISMNQNVSGYSYPIATVDISGMLKSIPRESLTMGDFVTRKVNGSFVMTKGTLMKRLHVYADGILLPSDLETYKNKPFFCSGFVTNVGISTPQAKLFFTGQGVFVPVIDILDQGFFQLLIIIDPITELRIITSGAGPSGVIMDGAIIMNYDPGGNVAVHMFFSELCEAGVTYLTSATNGNCQVQFEMAFI